MIQFVDISKLVLLENNPRHITRDQFDKLMKSLKEDPKFFELRPCLVHKTKDELVVYAGNQRVRAALKLGWKQVPCIVEEKLSKYIMQARVVKDNLHYGEFDFELLNSVYDIDMLLDAGFTVEELTGDYGDIKDVKIDDVEAEESQEKKMKECPKCGHSF